MQRLYFSVVIICLIGGIVCPPVKEQPREKPDREERGKDDKKLGLQYERYLKEVVSVLEEDEDFRSKLENANISDIKSGDIAQHLEFVSHQVRSQLDELKRKEVERLNALKKMINMKMEVERNPGNPGNKIKFNAKPNISKQIAESMLKMQGLAGDQGDLNRLGKHVDLSNPSSFEIDDLKKLIVQATNDLEDMDKKRREEFKGYEMEKETLRREKLKMMSERERVEAEEKFKQARNKHREHPKVNHPGNRKQLEEVWEEGDGMDRDDFDPKTFFFMHDTNGDGMLDLVEVEALFQGELDKVYDEDADEDDQMERFEEMSRMREHVYGQVDADKDGFISLREFIDSARDPRFEQDEDWDSLDDEEIYTEEELQRYEEAMRERIRQRAYHDGVAQPGEIQVPVASDIPPAQDQFAGQQQQFGNVQQMQQQQQQFQQQQEQLQQQGQPAIDPQREHEQQIQQDQPEIQQEQQFQQEPQQIQQEQFQQEQEGIQVEPQHIQQEQQQQEQPIHHEQQQEQQQEQIDTNQQVDTNQIDQNLPPVNPPVVEDNQQPEEPHQQQVDEQPPLDNQPAGEVVLEQDGNKEQVVVDGQ